MINPINFDTVADIYDYYVNVNFDVPFFLKETENQNDEILELMCGTGRVSIPLLQAGRKMVCIDYSKEMLSVFNSKVSGKDYNAKLVEMDVTKLNLDKKFNTIILPFHSLSEIVSSEKQQDALASIAKHLRPDGTFILTLQNPNKRLKQADGNMKVIGSFPIGSGKKMILSYTNQYNETENLVSGHQFYEIYDSQNVMVEKRCLEINFKPIELQELESMISKAKMNIVEIYGDYLHGEFNQEESDYMICKIKHE